MAFALLKEYLEALLKPPTLNPVIGQPLVSHETGQGLSDLEIAY
jgi:hypothetical protein